MPHAAWVAVPAAAAACRPIPACNPRAEAGSAPAGRETAREAAEVVRAREKGAEEQVTRGASKGWHLAQ